MEGARQAGPEDVTRLAELCQVALSELRPTRGGELFALREARAEPFDESFRRDLADPDATVWIGTLEGHGVGYGVARSEVLRNGARLGVISDIFVEPGAREVAVGEALMDGLLAWLAERECAAVDAYALPGDRMTKNFFEANGFSARLLVMHRRG